MPDEMRQTGGQAHGARHGSMLEWLHRSEVHSTPNPRPQEPDEGQQCPDLTEEPGPRCRGMTRARSSAEGRRSASASPAPPPMDGDQYLPRQARPGWQEECGSTASWVPMCMSCPSRSSCTSPRRSTVPAPHSLKNGASHVIVSPPRTCPHFQGAGKGKRIMGGKVPTESLVTPVDMVDAPAEPSGRGSEVQMALCLVLNLWGLASPLPREAGR